MIKKKNYIRNLIDTILLFIKFLLFDLRFIIDIVNFCRDLNH